MSALEKDHTLKPEFDYLRQLPENIDVVQEQRLWLIYSMFFCKNACAVMFGHMLCTGGTWWLYAVVIAGWIFASVASQMEFVNAASRAYQKLRDSMPRNRRSS